jgi:pilus assembly protein TadC
MTPVVFSLLAAGIWFSGRGVGDHSSVLTPASGRVLTPASGRPTGRRSSWLDRRRPVRAELSPGRLGLVSGASVVIAALAILGPVTGGVASAIVAPIVAAGAAQLARRARSRPDARRRSGLALTVDLLAAALRAGQPIDAALAAVATTADSRTSAELMQVAGLLRLGADAPEAWEAVLADPVLGGVARTACRSAQSGIRLAGSLEQLALELRAETRAAAQARAHRTSIWAMAPLGLCFLPAFVCVGVVPIVIGLAGGAFTAVS